MMQIKQRPVSALLKALLAVIIWGASFVATKVALGYVEPITVVWLRFGMGVLILGFVVLWRKQISLPQKKDWLYLALLGFLGITFHQWLQSNGLITAQAVTTGWIVASTPIFIALLGWLLLKEKLRWFQAAGILLAAVGVLLVITRGDLQMLIGGRIGTPGDFLILISAPNWAIFTTLSRDGLKRYPAALMMFYVMVFGWLFSTVLFIARSGWTSIPSLAFDGWLSVAFLGIFCSGVAYIAWYDALQVLPVAQTGAFLFIEPVVTVIVAAVVLKEQITAFALLGGLTILFGVWLVNQPKPA